MLAGPQQPGLAVWLDQLHLAALGHVCLRPAPLGDHAAHPDNGQCDADMKYTTVTDLNL